MDALRDLTIQQIIDAKFELYPGNPVIRRPANSSMVADPSIVTGREHIGFAEAAI